jgi:hypothetical protein
MQQTNRTRLIIIVAMGAIALLMIYAIFYFAVRAGKTSVTLAAVPNDASITMDGKSVRAGEIFLSPGKYTFVAHKEGFTDDKQVVTVGNDDLIVGLTPNPASQEAYSWLKNNPDAVKAREAYGGMNAERNGAAIRDKNPIMKLLPYYDPEGLFAINFGVDKSRDNGIFILINNSAPEGRQKALQWMERQGFNPAELNIRFGDFENPLTGKIERGV